MMITQFSETVYTDHTSRPLPGSVWMFDFEWLPGKASGDIIRWLVAHRDTLASIEYSEAYDALGKATITTHDADVAAIIRHEFGGDE